MKKERKANDTHIVAGLLQEGYKVRVLDNLSTGKLENLDSIDKKDVEGSIGDVTDLLTLDAAIDGCEYVFHQAAVVSVPKSVEAPIETGKVNDGGTLNVLEAARKRNVCRVMFASSAAVYGDEPTLPQKESMRPCPITPYGVDKLASEYMGHVYAQNFGIKFISLRYFNVFGSCQDPSSPYSGVIQYSVIKCFKELPQLFMGMVVRVAILFTLLML